MAKLVLEVKGNPKSDDVLVYDETMQCWKPISKPSFLGGLHKKILEQDKKIYALNSKIEKANENISTLAQIMKEGIK